MGKIIIAANKDDIITPSFINQLSPFNSEHTPLNFELLLNETAEIAMFLDSSGNVCYMNQNGCELLGYNLEEILGKNWFSLFIPESAKLATSNYYNKLVHSTLEQSDKAHMTHENEILTKTGQTLTLRWHNTLLYNKENKYLGAFSIGEDVTLQFQKTMILSSRERLRLYSEHHTLNELIQELLDISEQISQSSIGFFHFVDPDQNTLTLQTWSTNTLHNMCTLNSSGKHYPIEEAGVWVEAIYKRAPVIHNDYTTLPNKKGLPEGHAVVLRELVIPIFEGDSIVALLGVGNKLSPYSQQDLQNLQELSDLGWMIISKKKVEQQLESTNSRLQTLLVREKLLSQYDELTHTYSRRYLLELMEHELQIAKRYNHTLSIALIDLDYFKKINDTYGHLAGDKVLQQVCRSIQAELRSCDILGRLGGEEFILLLPQTDVDQSILLCERIRKIIEALLIFHDNIPIKLTISIGITSFNFNLDNDSPIEKLVSRVDAALYEAKDSGRNCIKVL
jgi:diguanylate cyclase (GGDEF)-like protein/PAS domain S-box-containing protein